MMMNIEIIEKIKLIKTGSKPKGYNKYKKDIFPSDWSYVKLGEVVNKIVGGGTPSREFADYYTGNIPWATVKDLKDLNYKSDTIEYITEEAISNSSAKLIDRDKFIISTRMGLGRGFINTVPMAINQDLKAIYPNENMLDVKYLMYWYKSKAEQIEYAGGGSTVKGIDLESLKKLQLSLPPINEQKEILLVIECWDKAIELKEKLLQEKKKQKKGMLERLLTGKVRLKGFNEEWNKVRLDKLIEESKERSTINNQYDILSVTKDGVFLQSEYFNRQIASEDNIGYKVVRKNNLVFSTMNLWMGSIDILDNYEVGIVSPACKVFYLNEEFIDVSFMKYFVKSTYMMNLYSLNSEQGASVVRRNLDLKGLLSTKVKLPTIEEQKEIGKILDVSSREINLLKKEIKLLKEQKKGLMQLLLTGIVRVKCD